MDTIMKKTALKAATPKVKAVAKPKTKSIVHKTIPGRFKANCGNGYAYLSNFFPHISEAARKGFETDDLKALTSINVTVDDITFSSSEQAYMYLRLAQCGYAAEATRIKHTTTALQAKQLNTTMKNERKKKGNPFDLSAFDADATMERVLFAKFSQNEVLKRELLDTGKTILAEIPGRSESVWTYNNTTGKPGLLGILLMKVRAQLQ